MENLQVRVEVDVDPIDWTSTLRFEDLRNGFISDRQRNFIVGEKTGKAKHDVCKKIK